MISEKQLQEWERLASEATEGPWLHDDMADEISAKSRIVNDEICIASIYSGGNSRIKKEQEANAAFIATAREAVPALIAEVRKLKAKSARFESEADWLAGHHGTQCVQYIDPHWACRDDKSCDDCWREAARKATEQKKGKSR